MQIIVAKENRQASVLGLADNSGIGDQAGAAEGDVYLVAPPGTFGIAQRCLLHDGSPFRRVLRGLLGQHIVP